MAGAAVVLLGLIGCAGPAPGDIGDAHFRAVAVRGAIDLSDFGRRGAHVWFESLNGRPTLIAAGPVNTSNVPVSFRGDLITPDASQATATLVGCGDPRKECRADRWLSSFVTRPMRYMAKGDELRLRTSDGELLLEREK